MYLWLAIAAAVLLGLYFAAARLSGAQSEALVDKLIAYRWIFVVPIVLPMSFTFDLLWAVRDAIYYKYLARPERHDARVEEIQRRVKAHRLSGSKARLCTARRNWLTVSTRVVTYKARDNAVPIELYDILNIDLKNRIVRVEPLVSMGQLTRTLIPLGYTLPVVPELDDLTVGGLVNGYGIEGSSHKYGLFNDICASFEIVTGTGELIRCSETENVDMFRAIPWSYGALGFLVAVEIRLIPCQPFVRLQYTPVFDTATALKEFERETTKDSPAEFVEGIMYSREHGVIMTGDFATAEEARKHSKQINPIGRFYQPWFYRYIEQFVKRSKDTVVEYIPLRDYYHRHSKSIFWEAELILPFGNHPLFRWTLGWLMPPKVSFLKLTQGEAIRNYYVKRHEAQDLLVPLPELRTSFDKFHEIFEIYPIWLCPHKTLRTDPQGALPAPPPNTLRSARNPLTGEMEKFEMWVDIGVWGVPGKVNRKQPYDGNEARKQMEAFLLERRGIQTLYAITELSRPQFSQMFDRELYNQVRRKYQCEDVFMDVYDKIKKRN